jgi:hypothetical protein
MSPIKLSDILRPFEGKWVALNKAKNKVLASGTSPDVVATKAQQRSDEKVIITLVPMFDLDYVG